MIGNGFPQGPGYDGSGALESLPLWERPVGRSCTFGGGLYRLTYWSDSEWAHFRPEDRPGDVARLEGLGYCRLEVVPAAG